MLTVSRIRMFLRDSTADQNYLLDAQEFTDEEIEAALEAAVDEWNETPPVIRVYTRETFPYPHHLLDGVRGYLLQMAADNYHRNHLSYSAAGISVDDKNKGDIYLRKADYYLGQWRRFMLNQKRIDNLNSAWITMSSR